MAVDILERVYQAFDPQKPLEAADTDRYVNLDEVRGSTGFVQRLAEPIFLSAKPTCQIVTGHHGSGKSTELLRLQRELQQHRKKPFVVYCEALEDIDRNDVDFPEVLIALVRQMAAQLRERAGIVLKPGYFKDRLQQLKGILGAPITIDEIGVDTGLLSLSATMKNSPDARAKVRAALEPDTSNLLNAANDLIGAAKMELLNKGYGDLVIIVDDLDKMVLRPCDKAACDTCEYLFINREGQLRGFLCHVVYTMPIACAYSSMSTRIANLYGALPPVVPMTKIATRPPRSKPYEPGIRKFREVIAVRLKKIGADSGQVFESDAVRDSIITLSGGQLRELMMLVREGMGGSGLPITQKAVQRAAAENRRAYSRQLLEEDWPIIEMVRKTGNLPRDVSHEEANRVLLDSRAILQYINDEDWYGVNPFVASLPRAQIRKRKK
jgi:hypothetical protein